jgi:hypothetical protein
MMINTISDLNRIKDEAMLLDKARFVKEDQDSKTHPIRVSFVYDLSDKKWYVHYDFADNKTKAFITRVERTL